MAPLALLALAMPAVSVWMTAGVSLIALFAVPRLLARPVGGMTGDLFGATVLIVETIVLVTGAVLT